MNKILNELYKHHKVKWKTKKIIKEKIDKTESKIIKKLLKFSNNSKQENITHKEFLYSITENSINKSFEKYKFKILTNDEKVNDNYEIVLNTNKIKIIREEVNKFYNNIILKIIKINKKDINKLLEFSNNSKKINEKKLTKKIFYMKIKENNNEIINIKGNIIELLEKTT
jgi:hypothetical protein